MIKLTLYNDSDIVLNADLIEVVEHTPDTLISLTTGKKLFVRETVEEVTNRIITYRRLIEKKNTLLSRRVKRMTGNVARIKS